MCREPCLGAAASMSAIGVSLLLGLALLVLHHALYAIQLLSEPTLPQGDPDHIHDHDQPRGSEAIEHVLEISLHFWPLLKRMCVAPQRFDLALNPLLPHPNQNQRRFEHEKRQYVPE